MCVHINRYDACKYGSYLLVSYLVPVFVSVIAVLIDFYLHNHSLTKHHKYKYGVTKV